MPNSLSWSSFTAGLQRKEMRLKKLSCTLFLLPYVHVVVQPWNLYTCLCMFFLSHADHTMTIMTRSKACGGAYQNECVNNSCQCNWNPKCLHPFQAEMIGAQQLILQAQNFSFSQQRKFILWEICEIPWRSQLPMFAQPNAAQNEGIMATHRCMHWAQDWIGENKRHWYKIALIRRSRKHWMELNKWTRTDCQLASRLSADGVISTSSVL